VRVDFDWDLSMAGHQVYEVDWEKGMLIGMSEKAEPWAETGTRTKTWRITCVKCSQVLPLSEIDSDLVTAMEDEY
jgi:hypothetical protein